MDLIELKSKILQIFLGTDDELNEISLALEADKAIFPFNEYEYMLALMVNRSKITFDQYLDVRSEYIASNPNLWIFEISAPRGFGEGFAQTYLHGKCEALEKPSKKRDPNYSGDYDFWLDGIKIEVKASRAVDSGSDQPLYVKALSRSSKSPFLMNFQQLKPQCCHVFVWLAVFRDTIAIWVMASSEVSSHRQYSKGQHRGNRGNEGQLHITKDNIGSLSDFELRGGDLGAAIKAAAKRNELAILET
jgi:hypothetical protein